MNFKTMALLLLILPAACRRGEAQRSQPQGEAQLVALAVRTEPAGATVRVNDLTRTWKTPCDIADYALQRGIFNVVISLPGHETVRRSVSYNGETPAILEVSLRPEGLAKAPEPKAAAPEVQEKPAPPVKPAPAAVENPEPVEAPAKAVPQAAPPAAGLPPGTRVRVVSSQLPVRITAGKVLVADGSRPGEVLLPESATEKILVEFLDPKTGQPLGVVEVLPRENRPAAVLPDPAPVPVPAPADPPPASDRVGKVQLVHRVYGVFVKLEPGLQLEPGEEIVIMRDGREVARSKIIRMIRQDETYPDGAVMLPKTSSIKKGDEVLRTPKP